MRSQSIATAGVITDVLPQAYATSTQTFGLYVLEARLVEKFLSEITDTTQARQQDRKTQVCHSIQYAGLLLVSAPSLKPLCSKSTDLVSVPNICLTVIEITKAVLTKSA